MPVRMLATVMYRIVQMMRDAMIPIGTSRCGFFASSDCVETASKPMYAKKIVAAPASIPASWPLCSWPQMGYPRKPMPPYP